MIFGVSSFDRQAIVNNNVALSKATRFFDVPVVLSTVETKAFSGNLWPQIQAIFPESDAIVELLTRRRLLLATVNT